MLSIAGFDPSSGAGVTADIKTMAAHGCYSVTCITALTVQSTQGVFQVRPLAGDLVSLTLEKLAEDFRIAAVRVGMLGSAEVAGAVADFLEQWGLPNVVLDPVIRSSSGAALLEAPSLEILRERLLPLCDVITPNIDEAATLSGLEAAKSANFAEVLPQMRRMAEKLHQMGSQGVVITGGHLSPANDFVSSQEAGTIEEVVAEGGRIDSRSLHGTGCAFAAALACELAHGKQLLPSVLAAKEYVRKAILNAQPLGEGTGPLNLL